NVIDKENRASLSGIDINTGKILWKLNYYSLSNYPPDVLDTSIYINGHSTIYKLSEEQN
ncbi:MAG: hypothetical protein H5U37_04920, partial [Caldisericia bacterium]|nr:hypothetical protein [Caldisericia bacterium]